jgi:hypothetical protein
VPLIGFIIVDFHETADIALPACRNRMFQLLGPIPLERDVDLSADGLSATAAQRTGRADIRVQPISWASALQNLVRPFRFA